jgi:hypothetical protein
MVPESDREVRTRAAAQESPTKRTEKRVDHLTEKEVKPALLRMIAAHLTTFSELAARSVRESPIRRRPDLEGDVVTVGNFICYLDRNEYSYVNGRIRGVFFRNKRSEWTGKVTEIVRD